jgi:hypothetical protein
LLVAAGDEVAAGIGKTVAAGPGVV